MGKAAQGAAKVAGDGADVAALAADEQEIGVVGIGAGGHVEPVDPKVAGGEVHRDPVAREVIGAGAVDPDGRDLRRDLTDQAAEGGEGGKDLRVGGAGGAGFQHGAGGIVGAGRRAEGARKA